MCPAHRVGPVSTTHDEARAINERYRRTLAVRAFGAIEIACKAHQLGAGSGASPGMRKHLVTISEPVDEFPLDRLSGKEWTVIDQGVDLAFRQFAALGDPANDLSGQRGE